MRRLLMILALCLPLLLLAEEPPKVSECESLRMEISVLRAKLARLEVESELSKHPLVMKVRMAEIDAEAKYNEAKSKEKKEEKK